MTEASRKLIAAARDGKFRDCKELMKLLPSLDFAEPPYCRTALWHAACRGHENVTRLLLDRGANVNHQDIRGNTALHEAALHGQQQIAELLIERGACIDVPNFPYVFSERPTCSFCSHDCLQLGDTPLFLAVYARRSEIVALLLNRGAEPNRANNAGLTCYHLAGVAASPGFALFLLHRGAYTNRFSGREQHKLMEALHAEPQDLQREEKQQSEIAAAIGETQGPVKQNQSSLATPAASEPPFVPDDNSDLGQVLTNAKQNQLLCDTEDGPEAGT
ncbi:hypothetical protein Esti_002520 [Eimeria stiedai]